MSKGKSYNRIVFVTTLSLYLGLVLVSGTSPALAHSAFSKHFDVRNEIEVKDDFDNKPDDCGEKEKLAKEKVNFLGKSEFFFGDYVSSLASIFNLSHNEVLSGFSFKIEDSDYETLNINLDKPFLFPKNSRQQIKDNVKAILKSFYVGNHPSDGNVNIDFNLDSKNLKATTFFPTTNNLDAVRFSSAYNASLKLGLCKLKNTPERIIYEGTEITSQNNQVFIVTRLPRAAIDLLLK